MAHTSSGRLLHASARILCLPLAIATFVLWHYTLLTRDGLDLNHMDNLVPLITSFSINILEFPTLLSLAKYFRGYRSNAWKIFVLDFAAFALLAWGPIWSLRIYGEVWKFYGDDGYTPTVRVVRFAFAECGMMLVLAFIHFVMAVYDLFQLRGEKDGGFYVKGPRDTPCDGEHHVWTHK